MSLNVNLQPGRRKKKGIRTRPKPKPMVPKPPSFDPNLIYKHRFRYTAGDTNTCTLTCVDLFYILTTNTDTATTTTNSCFSAVRLRKIQIWQTGSVNGTIALQANPNSAGQGGKIVMLTDTSYNAASIARLTYVPARMTAIGEWQNAMTTTTITNNWSIELKFNGGDIMDIIVEFIMDTNAALASLSLNYGTNTPSGGQLQSVDLPVASPHWVPYLTTLITTA